MSRKIINIIILIYVVGMGAYHIIPYEYLVSRLIFYICIYGIITGFLLYLKSNSLGNKEKKFYLIASIFSACKMIYHLWVAIAKYKYEKHLENYEEIIAQYQKGLIDFDNVLFEYDKVISEYNFKIIGIEGELFAAIFTGVVFLILILLRLNNGRMVKG